MTIEFRPAKMDKTPLMIGLAGPSGSGKTFTALRIAKGITSVSPGKIFMIDTEAKRGLHYAKFFQYEHGELKAPFRPENYLAAIDAAVKAGAAVIIIDSMSHEHEGPGGILEWQEEELNRMAGADYQKREKMKYAAWIKPKSGHNKFVTHILQNRVDVIFCFRAKEKLELRSIDGKVKPIEAGWQPICADRLEYEMTTLLVFPPQAKGTPDFTAKATKIQDQHRALFKPGMQIDENLGVALKKWAIGEGNGGPTQGVAEDNPANKEDLKGSAAEVSGMKAEDPLPPHFLWQTSSGKKIPFDNAESLYKYVIEGINKSTNADTLGMLIAKNAAVFLDLVSAGHGDFSALINKEAEDKILRLKGVMPPI